MAKKKTVLVTDSLTRLEGESPVIQSDQYMGHWSCPGRNRGREGEPCGEQYLSLL